MIRGTLTGYFERFGKTTVTVIGSGGKTSLLWLLAGSHRTARTLATTTTRMMRPDAASGLYDYLVTDKELPRLAREGARSGITFAGSLTDTPDGVKFCSLPLDTLEHILPLFEYAYIEGDGSKTLPLKAWADWEPVVTASTGVTVGILPLWPLGLPVSELLIHRLPLWGTLTGAVPGDILTIQHLVRAISGSAGLFKAARGRKLLFFNQVEDDAALKAAREVALALPRDIKQTLDSVIAGSVFHNTATVL